MVRVLLIGFDGAGFHYIKKLVEKGKLPNFAKFIQEGCLGPMKSTIPPISPVAWPSLYMGVNPGKHGIFHFVTPGGDVILSNKIAGKTVWDIISQHHKRVILLNMPMTYPPYPVNGIMVSGYPTPSNQLAVFPRRLTKKLRKAVPNYYVDTPYLKNQKTGMNKERYYKEICKVTKTRLQMALHLIQNYPWDFFAVLFTGLDRLSHVFWNDQTYRISDYFQILDQILSQIRQVPDDPTIFVVSDHGFEKLQKNFGVNNWLQKQGYLKKDKIQSRKNLTHLLTKLRHKIPPKLRRQLIFKIGEKTALHRIIRPQPIEPKKAEVYSPFPGAIISPHNSQKQIKKQLLQLNFVERVYEKEEIYKGKHLEEAPDLLLALKNGYAAKTWAEDILKPVKKPTTKKTGRTGVHQGLKAQRALFLGRGKNIKQGHVNSNIIDVAPAILKLMDIKIPSRIEGKPQHILDYTKFA